MKEEFCYLLRVRYAECDAQKVVFNGKYVEYIDVAITEFMRVTFGNYKDLIASGIDFQVVSVTVNWKAPAFFDDVLSLTMKVNRIGNTSYTMGVNFYNYQKQTKVATGEITYVMVDAEKYTKIKIPEEIRSKLKRGAPGVIVNHAGANLV